MKEFKLIVITGAPGTGKTTLAKDIAERFSLPLIVKDEIKEVLFDNVGWNIPGWDPDSWQKKIGIGAIEVMYHVSEQLMKAGQSHILESNFVPKFANQKILDWKSRYSFATFEIYCKCDSKVLLERFTKRIQDPNRHPGHAEETYLDELKEALATNRFDKIEVDGTIFEVDTTDFNKINYEKLYKSVEAFLKS